MAAILASAAFGTLLIAVTAGAVGLWAEWRNRKLGREVRKLRKFGLEFAQAWAVEDTARMDQLEATARDQGITIERRDTK